MEKLINLLNEYEAERKDRDWRFQRTYKSKDNEIRRTHTYLDSGWDIDFDNTNREIVSKSYGFIKWLVDNDKINLNKLEKIGYEKSVYEPYGQYREIVEYSDYESLLMLLSISNSPIEDLILYLK